MKNKEDIYQVNIKYLEENLSEIAEKVKQEKEQQDLILQEVENGNFTCKLIKGNRVFYLHSRYVPEREAQRLIDNYSFAAEKIWVVVGLGLGYGLVELAKRVKKEDEIIVIEKRTDLFKLSLKLFKWYDLLDNRNIKLIIGEDKEEVLKHFKKIRDDWEIEYIAHNLLVKVYDSYYSDIVDYLKAQKKKFSAQRNIIRIMEVLEKNYPKFCKKNLRILTFTTPKSLLDFVVKDCVDAFKELEHEVKVVNLRGDFKPNRESVLILEKEVLNYQPDFVFGINQFGVVPPLLRAMKIPHACWFLDEPTYSGWQMNYTSNYYALFICDRSFLANYSTQIPHLHYLPLATNDKVFRKLSLDVDEYKKYNCEVSFVGDSNYLFYQSLKKAMEDRYDIKDILNRIIEIQKDNPLLYIADIKEKVQQDFQKILTFENSLLEEKIEVRLELAAMVLYRKEVIEEVLCYDTHIYGDEGWKKLFFEKVQIFPEVDYHQELPLVYNASKINLSITKAQIKTAVTQRVYDVSACGGFVISDYRKDLDILFKPGKEIIYFKDKKELVGLVDYYLNHEEERREIAENAQRRVLQEHTYKKRMESLLDYMRKAFGDNLS